MNIYSRPSIKQKAKEEINEALSDIDETRIRSVVPRSIRIDLDDFVDSDQSQN